MSLSPKNIIIEFLSTVFIIIIIAFSVWFFILNNYFDNFTKLLKALAPFSFFILLFIIKMIINKRKLKQLKISGGEFQSCIYLDFQDKIKSDIIIFSLPIIIYGVPFLLQEKINVKINTLQALIVFIIAYSWRNSLFNKKKLI